MRQVSRPLGTDLTNPETRPWFLWDEDRSVGELHAILNDESHPRWRELAHSCTLEQLREFRARLIHHDDRT